MHTFDSEELRKTANIYPAGISDEELMFLLRNPADRQEQDFFFNEFHRRFHGRVQAWCLRLSRDRVRAIDLAQEVFLKAWRNLDGFRGDSRPSTWLYVIARNHCLTALQRRQCDPLDSFAPLSPRLGDSSLPHPDAHIERNQRYNDVCQVMEAALDPMEAQVLTLHYGYEVSLGALTKKLALVNPSGAKAYIVNGRRKLKAALKNRQVSQGAPPVSSMVSENGAALRKSA